MLRDVLTAVCVVELLAPRALIDAAERVALDNPDECELRSWVVLGARAQGLVVLTLVWRSPGSYSALKKFLGIVGVLATVSPRCYVDYGAELAYTDAADCEWRPWVYRGTRLVGVLYLLTALDELMRGSD